MRETELARLRVNYQSGDGRPLDDRFGDALGVGLRYLRALREEIDNDMSEASHGVVWWEALPPRQRILIGDHLLSCVEGVEINLIEAELHRSELVEWTQRLDDSIGTAKVVLEPVRRFALPPRTAPIDDLPDYMISLHTSGVARSLGSALDCLAAVVVGVAALPLNIMRASFARELLRSLVAVPARAHCTNDAGRARAQFRDEFIEELGTAGPQHWHDWVVNYRNMLVHRGRRMGTNVLVVRQGPAPRPGVERVLPSEPELSQVEAWARWGDLLGCGQGSYVLTERAEETLQRAQGSVGRLASRTCELLLPVWRARRAAPASLPQPTKQWAKIPSSEPSGFHGFTPGSFNVDAEEMISSPANVRRLRIAALDIPSSPIWRERPQSRGSERE